MGANRQPHRPSVLQGCTTHHLLNCPPPWLLPNTMLRGWARGLLVANTARWKPKGATTRRSAPELIKHRAEMASKAA